MNTIPVAYHKWHVVSGPVGATVTSLDGTVTFCTIPEGGQGAFYAVTTEVVVSDAAISVDECQNFKGAPVWMFGSGGGAGESAPSLPSGYIAVEFLEFGSNDKYVEVTTPQTPVGARVEVRSYERFYNVTTSGSNSEIGNGSTKDFFFWGAKNGKWHIGCGGYATTTFNADTNWHNMRLVYAADGGCWVDDLKVRECNFDEKINIMRNFRLGSTTPTKNAYFYPAYTWVKKCVLWVNGEKWRDVRAAVDATTGKPCFYDMVEGEHFYNGTETLLTVGMTIKQARKLGNLPAGGGTLKVSLPSNYEEDEWVMDAIADANAKLWNIEVALPWDASGASSTFAFRRIWVRKTQAEQGNYVASDGTRWAVESCVAMYNADGSEPDAHGYETFRSIEAAVAYWELEPYVNPEEELLTEPTTNEYE